MIKFSKRVVFVCVSFWALLLSPISSAVDNFVLLDQNGEAQDLFYDKQSKAIVVMIHGNGCQIIRSILPDFNALRDEYEAKGVRFLMLNANLQDSRETIASEALEWGIEMPILIDSAQIIGPSLGVTRTAEVLVINAVSREISYRGAINDRVYYERQKKEASEHYVKNALDAVLAGEQVAVSEVKSVGCIVNFPSRDQEISYSDTIAPLLVNNCVACHQQGGIAPWAMSEYRMVQGFAPMMREVVRTKRMPPWHADPEIGEWQHDAGLSAEETNILINWIEAGAKRGDGEDPLVAFKPSQQQWPLGEPDLIVEVPAFDVPASGIVEYQFPVVANTLDKDAWVVAATVVPGDTQAVHHVLLGSADQPPQADDLENVFQNYIMGYAPGNESAHMPEGTGVFVPKGGVYLLQIHYTPYGKKSTDTTKIGLYFADKPPQNFLRNHVVANSRLSIPPYAAKHEEKAYFEFWNDAVIYGLVPHAHYRGRSSSFDLIYPDGSKETILSVPNYDFNWQRTYVFTEPKSVPAGTKIIHRTLYDNSANNPGNPDPGRRVPWGLQSEDEMLYGSVSYSWVDETSSKPIHSYLTSETAQWMGVIDTDMDGLISETEMPKRLRDSIGWKWKLLDEDDDGQLNLAEMEVLMARMMERKKQQKTTNK
jgi:hypothetical protein|tara:strand:+ start:4451 stop:6406 length:1956 start_codon:yes stop_codon:yes gene_type:complete